MCSRRLGLPTGALHRYAVAIQEGYSSSNPYTNSTHGQHEAVSSAIELFTATNSVVTVALSTACYVSTPHLCAAADAMQTAHIMLSCPEVTASGCLDAVDELAILIAAMIHDFKVCHLSHRAHPSCCMHRIIHDACLPHASLAFPLRRVPAPWSDNAVPDQLQRPSHRHVYAGPPWCCGFDCSCRGPFALSLTLFFACVCMRVCVASQTAQRPPSSRIMSLKRWHSWSAIKTSLH
jgi:hypothetical protein